MSLCSPKGIKNMPVAWRKGFRDNLLMLCLLCFVLFVRNGQCICDVGDIFIPHIEYTYLDELNYFLIIINYVYVF